MPQATQLPSSSYPSSILSTWRRLFLPQLSRRPSFLPRHLSGSTSTSSSKSINPRGGEGGGGKTRAMSNSSRSGGGGGGWRRWKRALGQIFSGAGVVTFACVVTKDRQLAVPHISVPDIRWIDWGELEKLGFRGVVFDKDNTLTVPYSLSLYPPLSNAFLRCQSTFPGKIAVFSNSAGLYQYDPDGAEARALEDSIGGIRVIRHGKKKPVGTAEEIENYFGCTASCLIMVGDRHFTDVVYGNRNGFLTVLTEPLSLSKEPFIVRQVRKLEDYLVKCWCQNGLKPTKHSLVWETKQCVKVPPLQGNL